MARIKIEIPVNKLTTIQIPVRITDINYGNHLGNDVFVSIIHEARVQWLLQNHFSELNIGECGLIMGDLMIEYKSESFYGDTVNIDLFSENISSVSFDLIYHLYTTRDGKRIVLANAKTGMICYNYTTKKIGRMNDDFKNILMKQI